MTTHPNWPRPPRVAWVTAEVDFLDPDPDWDLEPTTAALRAAGLDVSTPHWDDASVDWSTFDLAIIRSTWNYAPQRDNFVAWAEHVARETTLLNPAHVVRDNTDKVYLERLQRLGVPIVPTQFVRPGESVDWSHEALSTAARVVVKPTIGAGAIGASLNGDRTETSHAIAAHHDAGRTVLVQPYLDTVDTIGEVAIVVIDGEISHAVRKVPALTVGGHGDAMEVVDVTAAQRHVVGQVAAAVPEWSELLYARVDVVPDLAGNWQLMELELTEPTLFLGLSPNATAAFVDAVVRRLS